MDNPLFLHIPFLTMLNFFVLLIFHQKISKNEFGIYRVNKFFIQSDNFNIRSRPKDITWDLLAKFINGERLIGCFCCVFNRGKSISV